MDTLPPHARDPGRRRAIDILVAGGGPAGTAAAVCAARLGAKVLLAEANGCLGGMGTSGLVSTFGPVSDGKRMLVGGFMKELVESMHQRGDRSARTWCRNISTRQLNRWVPFKPEALKRMLDDDGAGRRRRRALLHPRDRRRGRRTGASTAR